MKAREIKGLLPEKENDVGTMQRIFRIRGFNACIELIGEKELEFSVCDCTIGGDDGSYQGLMNVGNGWERCNRCHNGVIIQVKGISTDKGE